MSRAGNAVFIVAVVQTAVRVVAGTNAVTLLTFVLFAIGVALMAAPPAARLLERRRKRSPPPPAPPLTVASPVALSPRPAVGPQPPPASLEREVAERRARHAEVRKWLHERGPDPEPIERHEYPYREPFPTPAERSQADPIAGTRLAQAIFECVEDAIQIKAQARVSGADWLERAVITWAGNTDTRLERSGAGQLRDEFRDDGVWPPSHANTIPIRGMAISLTRGESISLTLSASQC